MKKLTFLFVALLLLGGCSEPAPSGSSESFFAMDTYMTITANDGDDQAASAARQEISRLESLFSRTLPDSDISRLNAAAGSGKPVTLDPESIDILSQAVTFHPAFDVTIAPVMDAWGFTTDQRQVPSPEELEELLTLVNWELLEIDPTAHTAQLPYPGMAVDLGGIAKGWAADRAAAILKEHGVTSGLLDLGGNITVLGNKPDGTLWRVAVRDPEDTSQQVCILSLSDRTLSTSGGYERYFESDGVTYHHIIDPATGYPAQSGLLSATVVSPTGSVADANSTNFFILGAQGALDQWRSTDPKEGLDLVLITEDRHVYITEGLEEGLQFEGETNGYTYEIVRR